MSIDTPARIAIIGAGPVGLEAALYARYLGYEVILFEQHTVCERLLQHGAETLPNRAAENRTSLGLAALRAQTEDVPAFDPAARETAQELAERYLLPLAKSDLLIDCIRTGHTVVRIERTDFPEDDVETTATEEPAEEDAAEDDEYEEFEELVYAPFELVVSQPDGTETSMQAEVVIDASGVSNSTPILFDSLRIAPDGLAESSAESSPGTTAEFRTLEPNFYRLGSITSATPDAFTIPAGHVQIRQLFAILGGRASLNLYATFQ